MKPKKGFHLEVSLLLRWVIYLISEKQKTKVKK